MPTNIHTVSREFRNQFYNNINFDTNLSEVTVNLAGNVSEQMYMKRTIDIEWLAISTASDSWFFNSSPDYIERSAGNFLNDGFSVGDTWSYIDVYSTGRTTPITATGTISDISEDGKRMYVTVLTGALPVSDTTDAAIYGTTPLTALIYRFGLLENTEEFNFKSKVSDNDQAYFGKDIGFDTGGGVRSTTFVDMDTLGVTDDWVTGSLQVRFIQTVNGGLGQQFEIIHIFKINPIALEGQIDDINAGILPDYLDGTNALKYAYSPEFRIVLSNPNSAKEFIINNEEGSTGGDNENFNGFDNFYILDSVEYVDTAVPATIFSAINIEVPTTVKIDISKSVGSFTTGHPVICYVTSIPPEEEYQNTTTDMVTNFIFDSARTEIDGASDIGLDFITRFEATLSGGVISLEIDIDYSTAQQQRLSPDSTYKINVLVGDFSLTSGNSDRVSILVDIDNYIQDLDIPDLMSSTKLDVYPHDKTISVDTGFTDALLWNEDGFTIDGSFTIDLNKSAFINTLDFVVVAKNVITGEQFDLDSYSFQIANSIVSSGVQQLISDTTRGYKLDTDDQFNTVSLSVGVNIAGVQTYNYIIGQKTPWQSWIDNLNADTVFFDTGEEEDNLNLKSSNYSDINNYQINVELRSNVAGISTLGRSGNTDYSFTSPDFTINNYDEDGEVTPVWSQVIETFNADTLAPLGDSVMSGTDTLLKITWTNSIGPVSSTASFYGIHRIEIIEDKGSNIEEISSIRSFPSNNILKPLTGETQLKISAVAGKIITECIIDGSLIKESTDFNLSGRINDTLPENAKLRTDLVPKETTGNEIKITAP